MNVGNINNTRSAIKLVLTMLRFVSCAVCIMACSAIIAHTSTVSTIASLQWLVQPVQQHVQLSVARWTGVGAASVWFATDTALRLTRNGYFRNC